jgi:hypothetical protein
MTGSGAARLDHLDHLSDQQGLFEHALGTARRPEHGYCTDDNARLLVVTSREADQGLARRLSRVALRFVLDAQRLDGRCRNRMDRSGRWTDPAGTADCWGRALLALGSAAAHHEDPLIRRLSLSGFERGTRQRSEWPRATAFAALGAAEVLSEAPDHEAARLVLVDALDLIGPTPAGSWPWPEARLTYANASLAEAVIAAGAALERPADLDRGLAMLGWLLEMETLNGHLSVTGVDGRGPNDHGPQFDQQPIEVAAMADACWRALRLTGDSTWSRGIAMAGGWFAGQNDTGLAMYDEASGGGYDGLHADGVNVNQGAESSLAFVSTTQRARSFATAP